ncbi:MAG: RsmD family RNA methyltransferase [Candidatus Methanomethylicia archaeon]
MLNNFTGYNYSFKKKKLLTRYTAMDILEAVKSRYEKVKMSFDLGLSEEEVNVKKEDSYVIVDGCIFDLKVLEEILEKDYVYILNDEKSLEKVAFYADGKYYKLKCVARNSAPTLEINGINMHRIVGVTPWEDALMKVKAAKVGYGMRVLDICTGLGYTAIASINMGASMVLSIEKDLNVIRIAELNPWSKGLEDHRIKIIIEDASRIIREIEEESFDRIIHDPPRISLAGELYSSEFYIELYRVLKKNGILYHYTGQPGIKRRKDIVKGVSKRIMEAGFKVKVRRDLLGILAFKD